MFLKTTPFLPFQIAQDISLRRNRLNRNLLGVWWRPSSRSSTKVSHLLGRMFHELFIVLLTPMALLQLVKIWLEFSGWLLHSTHLAVSMRMPLLRRLSFVGNLLISPAKEAPSLCWEPFWSKWWLDRISVSSTAFLKGSHVEDTRAFQFPLPVRADKKWPNPSTQLEPNPIVAGWVEIFNHFN